MARKIYRSDFSGAFHFIRHTLFALGLAIFFADPDRRPLAVTLILLGAPYNLPFNLLARAIRPFLPKPKPITPDRLADIISPYVLPASDDERALLLSLCADAILSPDFKDHWNSAEYHSTKPTSRAQAEKIRELGYTGKIPARIREASAIIEVLKIAKTFNLLRRKANPLVP